MTFPFEKFKFKRSGRGMTYVELIVVMSVFSIISTVIIFNHKNFQAKVDLKNLANDIALRFVEAQKSSLSGKLSGGAIANWKPSYGIHFKLVSPGNNTNFIYFADLNQDKFYDVADLNFCANPYTLNDECLNKTAILRGSYVSEIRVYYTNSTNSTVDNLAVTFTRPNSVATFSATGVVLVGVSYVQVRVTSPNSSIPAYILLHSSGKVEIN